VTKLAELFHGTPLLWAIAAMSFCAQGNAEEPAVAKAREYFRAGAQAYAVGEYAAAVQAFEQAHAIAPRPAVLFSIAQTERRLFFLVRAPKHLRRSVELYRQYIAEEAQPARKADAVQALSELEPLLATLEREGPTEQGPEDAQPTLATSLAQSKAQTRVMISTPAAGAVITLGNQASGSSPLVREVEPGEHVVRITAPGYRPTERRVVAVGGELVTVDLPLVEQPALLDVLAPPGAQLSIDGRVQGRFPFPKPIELSSGVHLITVSQNGFVGVSSEETLTRGRTTVFRAPLRVSRQRTVAKFMLGASVSALMAGGVFAYFAYSQEQAALDFRNRQGNRPLSTDDLEQYNTTKTDRDRLRGAAWLSCGVGLGLSVTSALMFIYDSGSVEPLKKQEKPTNQSKRALPNLLAEPTVGPGFTGLSLQGSF
jgi:hypothetical protein